MSLLDKAFTEHPASVNETYLEHLAAATGFGVSMLLGGLACLIHGLVPCLFTGEGSRRIRTLHARMVENRVRRPAGDRTLDDAGRVTDQALTGRS